MSKEKLLFSSITGTQKIKKKCLPQNSIWTGRPQSYLKTITPHFFFLNRTQPTRKVRGATAVVKTKNKFNQSKVIIR